MDQMWQVTVGVEFGSRTVDVNGCGSQETPRSPQGLVDGWWLVGGANMLKVDFFCSASMRSGRGSNFSVGTLLARTGLRPWAKMDGLKLQ